MDALRHIIKLYIEASSRCELKIKLYRVVFQCLTILEEWLLSSRNIIEIVADDDTNDTFISRLSREI